MQWRLCNDTKWENTTEPQLCFNEHILEIVSATASNNAIDWDSMQVNVTTGEGSLYVYANLSLPAGLTCDRCVLQFTYLGKFKN